jgi:hypothetical protein
MERKMQSISNSCACLLYNNDRTILSEEHKSHSFNQTNAYTYLLSIDTSIVRVDVLLEWFIGWGYSVKTNFVYIARFEKLITNTWLWLSVKLIDISKL